MNFDDLNTEEPIPEILQAEWAKDQVLQLFADLAAGADVQHVQLRAAGVNGAVTLAIAEDAFAADQAHAIQVRYEFENEMWCDTIMPGSPTTKIVRTRLPNHLS